MKFANLIFASVVSVAPFVASAATPKCSQTNMTRCLDSVCAINIGMNPAARCQYCGTSSAGTPPAQKGLKTITAGQSSKYALSAKELAVAPSDPGKRYIWATTECIKKVGNCTTDDVSNIYDKLIEQSCKAAGVSMQTARAIANNNQKPTKSACETRINICATGKCGTNFENCADSADMDRVVAECAADATGCDEYIASIKTEFIAMRDKALDTRETAVQSLAQSYQKNRENKLASITTGCKDGTQKRQCVQKYEAALGQNAANLACEFYAVACAKMSTGNASTTTKTIATTKTAR